MRPKQVRMRCGSGCGTGSKMIALGYENSLVPQARQYDGGKQFRVVRQYALSARKQRLRIFGRLCGFSGGRADYSRPRTVRERSLGLKTADFKPIRRKIPMMNPHKSSKIRTAGPESAHTIKNPHGRPESAWFVFLCHESQTTSLHITQKIRSATDFLCPDHEKRAYLPVGAETRIDHHST